MRAGGHPRASGEHNGVTGIEKPIFGSSPRERGTRIRARNRVSPGRFIPARAGNTSCANVQTKPSPVHPRASGEHSSPCTAASDCTGSSPRERGTPRSRRITPHLLRFIPARAGNTSSSLRMDCRCSVHPRASGEHNDHNDFIAHDRGSSPRERGTRPSRRRPSSPPAVHPRASGEHWVWYDPALCRGGSSPRERGTLF